MAVATTDPVRLPPAPRIPKLLQGVGFVAAREKSVAALARRYGSAFTLRERAMLGDTGSNLVGAIAGVWLLTTLGGDGRLVALAAVVALTVYGELRSISAAIESVPPLRWLDSLGRVNRTKVKP